MAVDIHTLLTSVSVDEKNSVDPTDGILKVHALSAGSGPPSTAKVHLPYNGTAPGTQALLGTEYLAFVILFAGASPATFQVSGETAVSVLANQGISIEFEPGERVAGGSVTFAGTVASWSIGVYS